MATSSVGSDIFALLSILVISLLVLLLLRYYLPLRTTPAYLLVPVFLALALPSSIILLVPIDLASSDGTDTSGSRGIWLPDRVMLVAWRICYWLTFALTWVILPLLGEYTDSGYREPKDRFMYALRSNGRYQLMVLGSGILGGVYFFLQSGVHVTSLKALVMALAYAWGLILAVYLMGHGLVALPRRLFRNASIGGRLRRLQAHAPKVHDKLTEAIEEVEQHENQVMQLRQRKTGTARDFQEWIDELAEVSSLPESRVASRPGQGPSRSTVPPVITERYLADLTRKLKRARHKKARFIDEWDRLLQSASRTQAIPDSRASHSLVFPPTASSRPSLTSKLSPLTPYTRYHLHAHLIPSLYLLSAVLAALASTAILWSELTKPFTAKLSLISPTVLAHPLRDRPRMSLLNQLLAAAWLAYANACALLATTEARLWGNRALVRRQTYPESAAWYASYVARLTVPLAYDFVTTLPRGVYGATTFHRFLGRLVNLTPLGEGFARFFPAFVLLPVAATGLGWYGKVGRAVGVSGGGWGWREEEDEEGGMGAWREGKLLIERELGRAEGGAVGLAQRAGGEVGGEADAEGVGGGRCAGTSASSYRAPAARPERRPLVAEGEENGRDEDEEEGNFFQDFAHRVRNTFEVAERPAWLANVGEGFKRPRWMGGGDEDEGGGSGGNGFGRWFGRRGEGRVRLR